MTSNLGTEFVTRSGTLGFQRSGDTETRENEEKIERALKDTFRPEFLNRIDEVIIFSQLSPEDMERIVDLQMEQVRERLSEHGIEVDITDSARTWLAQEGYDPAFGARPLKRALQKHVESPLSIRILQGEFGEGDRVIVDFAEEDGLVFRQAESGASVEISEQVPA